MPEPWMRVSDDEREEVVELLRGHMLAGRLSSDELEERTGEAWAAHDEAQLDRVLRELPPRRAPAVAHGPPVFVRRPVGVADDGGGSTALRLGVVGLVTLTLSLGALAFIALPLCIAAWVMGAAARRGAPRGGGPAFAGQVLGIIGSVASLLVLAAVVSLFIF